MENKKEYLKHKYGLPAAGWIILLVVWYLVSHSGLVNTHILPTPEKVIIGMKELIMEDHIFKHIWFSIRVNLFGYIECILFALPLGFALGLFPTLRRMFSPQIDAIRFVPLPALMGIFITLSGLTIMTKINFLAFGIFVYLVPVIVQRIDEVQITYLQMMKTLGATRWQTVKYVIWKSVIARLSDDIRILVAISWTYIMVAELAYDTGGLGTVIFMGQKTAQMGKVYSAIFIIMALGASQDKLFRTVDKLMFKHKYL